jgi:hypothetical protein
MVLDTDTYNEIDDQFALVHALLSPERLKVEAIYAAPFHNDRSTGPGDGMEKSFEEILRLLARLDVEPGGLVFRGATEYLGAGSQPPLSPAVEDLISRALASAPEDPLYVVAIGCITNVAAALLFEPALIDRVVIVWLGGQPLHFPSARHFNLRQDPVAARVVFDGGVPLVHVPCDGVASHLLTTLAELEQHVAGRGAIGDYLVEIFRAYRDDHFARAKEIWDLACIAWLIDPEWVPSDLVPSPVLTEDLTWHQAPGRHPIRNARFVHRNPIFADLFRKLEDRAAA